MALIDFLPAPLLLFLQGKLRLPWIGGDLLRFAFRNFDAIVEHDHPIGKIHHRLHDVFDHQNRNPPGTDLLNDLHHLKGLGRYQPGSDLIQKQQLGLRTQSPGQFKALFV